MYVYLLVLHVITHAKMAVHSTSVCTHTMYVFITLEYNPGFSTLHTSLIIYHLHLKLFTHRQPTTSMYQLIQCVDLPLRSCSMSINEHVNSHTALEGFRTYVNNVCVFEKFNWLINSLVNRDFKHCIV